ncbi:alpha/beta hydrolase [Phanerochaete sordida]|uniref:Alpha/beta hydrolase n=1 Tax=Phanerochaete sordida TaxID=48140 RepID=A0A9P3LE58_9APHY|nr:alpha/beta hydrolase [Phanerochaete sordida]
MAEEVPQAAKPRAGRSLFTYVYRGGVAAVLLYIVFIGTLSIPAIQKQAVFKHGLKFPMYANYDAPEKYSLAPGKALNVHFSTPDNFTLGAWFVLADPYYQHLRATSPDTLSPLTESVVRDAIRAHPTILFLHGAGGTRASPWRLASYRAFNARLHANVFAVDYRGFGDSTGSPDAPGLALDAYTAWTWLGERGAAPGDVVVVGQSLGTGVAAQLMRRLAEESVVPRGVALLAPFSKMGTLIETYAILGVPVLRPLQSFPWGVKLLKRLIRHELDTLSAIGGLHAPTLLAHAQDDAVIPHAHSRTLIDTLLAPLLPALSAKSSVPDTDLSPEELLARRQLEEEHSTRRGEVVRTTEVPNFGVVEEFKGLRAPVVYVESFAGFHAQIGLQEGVQDEMAKLFGLGVYRVLGD